MSPVAQTLSIRREKHTDTVTLDGQSGEEGTEEPQLSPQGLWPLADM